jgi:heat shock protein HslJ
MTRSTEFLSRRTVALAFVAAALVGCTSTSSAADAPPLDRTAWVLEAIPGMAALPGPSITLRFEDGRASGSDGCNRYGVGYTARGGAIEIPSTIASTRVACPPNLMRQADAYLAALTGARRYRVDAGRLQLIAADGSVRATFAPQSQALAGTRWRATGIHDGKAAVVSTLADSTVTLEFGSDGQASGSAGCNRFTARYEADGATLRFGPAASTRRMCPDPALMAQEAAFLKALETVASDRIEGRRLELRTASGALAVSLQSDAAP